MTEFTIGNICKEIQRIEFDLRRGDNKLAIRRCEELDQLLCEVEDGKHTLIIGDTVIKRRLSE